MYITINDVIGKKRIDLSYPIKDKEIAVIMGKSIVLNKGVYMDKELNSLKR